MHKLLYHAPENSDQESPFDIAIVQIVQGQAVCIVSPYIGLNYLRRLIGLAASWRLVSDVEAWLEATSVTDRPEVVRFLEQHEGKVHHYPAVHAKTVVSAVGAYTGSANLTDAGILRRTEFGVMITMPTAIEEIQGWFDAIWCQSSPPLLEGVATLVDQLNRVSLHAKLLGKTDFSRLDSGAREVRARLTQLSGVDPLPSYADRGTDSDAAPAQVRPPPDQHTEVAGSPTTARRRAPAALPPAPFELYAATVEYIDRNAGRSFTFGEFFAEMKLNSPTLKRRAVYLSILEFCASQPRTLFAEESVNRLVYREGRFYQSESLLLEAALQPMDALVSWILRSLSFETKTPSLDNPAELRQPKRAFHLVLSGMSGAAFFCGDDGFMLSSAASWSPRLKLLKQAYSTWESRLAQYRMVLRHERDAAPGSIDAEPGLLATAQDPVPDSSQDSEISAGPREMTRHERLQQIDEVFARLARRFGQPFWQDPSGIAGTMAETVELGHEDIRRLLVGSYTGFRSPFFLVPSSVKKQYTVAADLQGNQHLPDLPLTSLVIETTPELKRLTLAPQTVSITRAAPPGGKTFQRFKDVTKDAADQMYRIVCRRIFTTIRSPMEPMPKADLLWTLAQGDNPSLVEQLIFNPPDQTLALFSVNLLEGQRLTITLRHPNLKHFPKTLSYLRDTVWISGTRHDCLPPPPRTRSQGVRTYRGKS